MQPGFYISGTSEYKATYNACIYYFVAYSWAMLNIDLKISIHWQEPSKPSCHSYVATSWKLTFLTQWFSRSAVRQFAGLACGLVVQGLRASIYRLLISIVGLFLCPLIIQSVIPVYLCHVLPIHCYELNQYVHMWTTVRVYMNSMAENMYTLFLAVITYM